MNKLLVLLISTVLIGCTSPVNQNSNKTSELISDIDEVHLFYHYVNRDYPSEPTALLTGKFEIEGECLYWISYTGKKHTPLFPEYPEGIVEVDVKRNTLRYGEYNIKIGEKLATNGAMLRYKLGSPADIEYEKQGHIECLATSLAIIGTSFTSIESIKWLDESNSKNYIK